MRVLAKLGHPEETIAFSAQLIVDHCVDLESEGSSLRSQVSMLMIQLSLARIELVFGLVDANIEHIPLLTILGSLELPITEDMCCLVAVSERVMGRAEASVTTNIDTEERVRFIFCATVSGTAANKAINFTS